MSASPSAIKNAKVNGLFIMKFQRIDEYRQRVKDHYRKVNDRTEYEYQFSPKKRRFGFISPYWMNRNFEDKKFPYSVKHQRKIYRRANIFISEGYGWRIRI
jgi:hypothetical protein